MAGRNSELAEKKWAEGDDDECEARDDKEDDEEVAGEPPPPAGLSALLVQDGMAPRQRRADVARHRGMDACHVCGGEAPTTGKRTIGSSATGATSGSSPCYGSSGDWHCVG